MEKQGVAMRRAFSPCEWAKWGRIRSFNSIFMGVNPASHFAKNPRRLFRNAAGAIGTDIKHIGTTATDDTHKALRDFARAFPIMIIPGIAPGIVNSVWRLPQAGPRQRRYFLVAQCVIVAQTVTDTAVDQTPRLKFMNQIHQHL